MEDYTDLEKQQSFLKFFWVVLGDFFNLTYKSFW